MPFVICINQADLWSRRQRDGGEDEMVGGADEKTGKGCATQAPDASKQLLSALTQLAILLA